MKKVWAEAMKIKKLKDGLDLKTKAYLRGWNNGFKKGRGDMEHQHSFEIEQIFKEIEEGDKKFTHQIDVGVDKYPAVQLSVLYEFLDRLKKKWVKK